MKHASGHGFFLCFLLNLLFRAEWLIPVAILLVLHFALGWPLWLLWIPLGCWVLHSLLITLILGWASGSCSDPLPKQENKNPYSRKNSDYLSALQSKKQN